MCERLFHSLKKIKGSIKMRERMTEVIHGNGLEKMWQSLESWEKWQVLLLLRLCFALAKPYHFPSNLPSLPCCLIQEQYRVQVQVLCRCQNT